MKNNDKIIVFNGCDGEWYGRLNIKHKKDCYIELTEQIRIQTQSADLAYLFAPLKNARFDYMVQKAVEMGSGILQPVITDFTQVRRINLNRMRSNAIEAAEQCGILNIPKCMELITLYSAVKKLQKNYILYFCDEQISKPFKPLQANIKDKKIAVLIGPEGGFSNTERNWLLRLPFVIPMSLGERILRADTAAVAAMAIIQNQ